MRLIISFAALYLSVVLLQLSNGGVGPLDALSGLRLKFTTDQIGLLGLVIFRFYRMLSRPSVEEKTDYVYSPRTSFLIGRLLKSTNKDKNYCSINPKS